MRNHKPDIAGTRAISFALRISRRDPKARDAIRPANRVTHIIQHLEPKKYH
jgi:hypothetical protein